MRKNQCGLTLVELAIVIVIIALIATGIMVGRDMIRSSQIRAVVNESQFYIQALNNFKDKYGALPGDFSTATSVWTEQNAVAATCVVTVTSLDLTCNGDGNGWITTQGTSSTYYEQFRAWQQLYLANMIPTNVTPITGGDGTQDRKPGYNIPKSKLEGAGWGLVGLSVNYVLNTDTSILNYYANDVPPNHVLSLGGKTYSALAGKSLQQAVLSGPEAKSIDSKIDDGMPNHGKIVVQLVQGDTQCYASNTTFTLTAGGKRICTLFFKTGL